jgi:uncharacterized RDD family membrane protein YckC
VAKQITIRTPEDIDLSYEIAGPGSRIAAGLIDLSIIWSIIFALALLLMSTGGISVSMADIVEGRMPAHIGKMALVLLLGATFSLNIGYFVFFECLRSGQSIGKRAIGLRVVNDTGQAVSLSASLIRNISRVVDFLPGPYAVAFISVLVSQKGQRIGDLIAGTIVTRFESVAMPRQPFAGIQHSDLENPIYNFRHDHLAQIGKHGFQVLDEYFHRKEQIVRLEQDKLEQKLADAFLIPSGISAIEVKQPLIFLKELYLSLREHLNS